MLPRARCPCCPARCPCCHALPMLPHGAHSAHGRSPVAARSQPGRAVRVAGLEVVPFALRVGAPPHLVRRRRNVAIAYGRHRHHRPVEPTPPRDAESSQSATRDARAPLSAPVGGGVAREQERALGSSCAHQQPSGHQQPSAAIRPSAAISSHQ
eukprot:7382297-Prymnesium_polylepis.1